MQKRKLTFQREDYPLSQHTDSLKKSARCVLGVWVSVHSPRGMRGSMLWTQEFPCKAAEQVLIPHMSPGGATSSGPQSPRQDAVGWRTMSEARSWLIHSQCLLRMRTPVGHRGGHSRGHRHRLRPTGGGQEGPEQGLASREEGMRELRGTGSSSSFCPIW